MHASPKTVLQCLGEIDAYERENQNRTTILSRVTTLRGAEPWTGYNELTAEEVKAVLSKDDEPASAGLSSPPTEGASMSLADKVRKIPGVAAAEGAITGAVANEQDLPIKDYDKQTAADITAKLKGLSQRELRVIDAYEREHENRATITDKIAKLSGDEPWSGYDEQSAEAIASAVRDADEPTAKRVREYERDRKDRAGVLQAADQRIGAE
jgi:hypothetical protein